MGMAARTKVLTYSAGQLATPIPGTWRINGKRVPIISCPVCGYSHTLWKAVIGRNGIIKGTFRCENINCSWSARIQLAGWSEYGPDNRRKSQDSGGGNRKVAR